MMRFYNQPHAFYCGVDLHARQKNVLSLHWSRDLVSLVGIGSGFVVLYGLFAATRRHLEVAGSKVVSAGAHSGAVYFQDPFGLVFDIMIS